MHEFPSAFSEFLSTSPVIQEFLREETWGDKLRKQLQGTDPHWKILGWREYPKHTAVACVAASTRAGTDLFVFRKMGLRI